MAGVSNGTASVLSRFPARRCHYFEERMPDIRINLSFPNHRKTKKLVALGGEGMIRHLLKLWCYAAEHKQNGTLSNMEDFDISLVADYTGTDFVQKVIDAGFIDDVFPRKLHDWKDHQGWIVKAPKRKAQAKRAAVISWESRRKGPKQPPTNSNATSKADPYKEQCPLPLLSSPLLSSPNPTLPISKEKSSPAVKKPPKKVETDFQLACEYFCEKYRDKVSADYGWHGQTVKSELSGGSEQVIYTKGQDSGKMKTLLTRWSLKQIFHLIDILFNSTDEFYRTGGGYSIGVLLANDNKLVQEAKRIHDGTDKLNEAGAKTAANIAKVLKEMECEKPLLE